jgi:hypothetical protein
MAGNTSVSEPDGAVCDQRRRAASSALPALLIEGGAGLRAGATGVRHCSIEVVSSMKRPSGFWKKSCTFEREMLRYGE